MDDIVISTAKLLGYTIHYFDYSSNNNFDVAAARPDGGIIISWAHQGKQVFIDKLRADILATFGVKV